MGFFDSIAGFGRAALRGIGSGIEIAAPIVAQAGAQLLAQRIAPPVVGRGLPMGPLGAPRPAAFPMPAARTLPSFPFPMGGRPLGFAPGGGIQTMPAFPVSRAAFDVGTRGGGFLEEATESLGGLFRGQPTFFELGMPRAARAVPQIEAQNPVTGRTHVWKHMGRPILYTGDLAACKRVSRISARVARARPRKR
jgi:hypothetical protein